MPRRLLPLVVLLLATAHAQPADYGETAFANSGAAEAQEPFLRGLLMLHSFEYEDAREAFQEARRIDPDFVMAAWGEALTHNHPIWQDQDRDAALAALGADLWDAIEQGDEVAEVTAREEDYLMTLRALYGDGAKEDRDFAYADALGDLAAQYPDDLDAAAFYALAILGTAHDGRDFTTYMEAAAIAEEVFEANPRHPGAAHYLIHAYDDPVHAPLGLRPARVYAEIAPAASHALHMPSHIYFALGMWDEGAVMNRRSYEAAKTRTDARGEPLNGHGWHALQWMHYAYLQRGQNAKARWMLELARREDANAPRRRVSPLMRAHYLIETEEWDGEVAQQTPDLDGASLYTAAQSLFADGYAALRRGDQDAANAALHTISRRLRAEDDPPPEALIPKMALEALLSFDAADPARALSWLESAVAAEDELPLDFGPARAAKPAHELLGDVLLDLGEAEQAAAHFEKTLARYPRRSRALLGLARAAAEAGDEATAQAAYADLAHTWRDADADLPALDEVRERAELAAH